MDYLQFDFVINPNFPWRDILLQELADINFESFTTEDKQLQAYIQQKELNEDDLQKLIKKYRLKNVSIKFERQLIPAQNWNAAWEADYKPVSIDGKLLIYAPFHSINKKHEINIEIQPQMSFGTGHHPTTYLMCKALLELDLKHKNILDVGTGTGVLGILSSKLGAKSVTGTEIQEEALSNAVENCKRNKIENFKVLEGDINIIVPGNKYFFDTILANINKNVLIYHLESYSLLIKDGGELLISGFFDTDIKEILNAAEKFNFILQKQFTKENWAVLKLRKTIRK